MDDNLTSWEISYWNDRACDAAEVFEPNTALTCNKMTAFADFLGDPCPSNQKDFRTHIVNILNPEIRKKLDLILGPHGKTVLKILEARRESK